jgi:hypothetical protein
MAREHLKSSRAPGKKSNSDDVNESSRGSNIVNNSAGGPGRTFQQRAIPGPTSPGQPIAEKRALARKPIHGTATGAAGTIR